jgi:hypothetical protein
MVVFDGVFWYLTLTRVAAYCARSSPSAITIATGWPA